MSDRAPYSRVYWTVRDDPRLAAIYPDDHHWATWNRLLLAADMAWPAPADLPANARRSSVKALTDAGVIELLPSGLFRFHGLEAERGRRRAAATSHVGPKRDPSDTHEGPSRGRAPRLGSSSLVSATPRDGLDNITPTVEEAWKQATGRSILGSGAFAADYVDDAARRHGETATAAAIVKAAATFTVIPTPQQLAVAVRGILDPLPDSRKAAEHEREAEREQASRRRSIATIEAGHYAHGEPHPRCPKCAVPA